MPRTWAPAKRDGFHAPVSVPEFKLYAPAWKPWTPVEAVDKKLGAVSEKP